MYKVIINATQDDANQINSIIAPVKGSNSGGGFHIDIPDNWLDLIAAGQSVPGCTYCKIEDNGSIIVDSDMQAALSAAGSDLATKLSDPVFITFTPGQ